MTGIQVISAYIYKYYKTFGPKTLYQHNTYGEIALCKVHTTNSLRKQLLIVGTYTYLLQENAASFKWANSTTFARHQGQ